MPPLLKKIAVYLHTSRHQLIKYIIVGLGSFAIDYGGFALLHVLFDTWYLGAAAISQLFALVFNFSMNHRWTFKAESVNAKKHLTRYLILQIWNYSFSLLLIYLLVDIAHFPALIGKLGAIACIVTWNFFVYQKIVYK